MPSAYGNDRVRPSGTGFLIACTRDKGWHARTPATRTTSEFPGTAVEWDGAMFEVVAIETGKGVVRYRLEPWRNDQTIRELERYDEAAETARAERWADHRRRTAIGRRIEIAGVFTGLAPAEALKHFGLAFGVSVPKIILSSTLVSMLFGVWCARYLRIPGTPYTPPPFPEWVIPIGLYLFLESLVRIRFYLMGIPFGSAFGWIVFGPWLLFGGHRKLSAIDEASLKQAASLGTGADQGKRRHAKAPAKEWGILPEVDADAERKLHDSFIMREPLVVLLSRDEQLAMQRRFGFNYMKEGTKSVIVLSLIAALALGVGIQEISLEGARFTRLLSAGAAMLLLIDQVQRARQLVARQPAASMLAGLARPFLRKVLAAPPVQPVFEGDGRNVTLPDVWDDEAEIVRDERPRRS